MRNRRKIIKNNKKNKISIFRIILLLGLLLWVAFLWYSFILNKKIILKPEYDIISSSNKYINTDYFLDNWKNIWVNFSNKTNIIISSNLEKKPNVKIPRNFALKEYKVEKINSKYYHIFNLEFINKIKPLIAVPNSSQTALEQDLEQNKINTENNIQDNIQDNIQEWKELEKIKEFSDNVFLSWNINIDSLNKKRLENSKYLQEQENIKNIEKEQENLAIQKVEEDIWSDNLDSETLRKKIIKEQWLDKVESSIKKIYNFKLLNKDSKNNKVKLNIINTWNIYAEYSNLDNKILNNLKINLVKKIEILNNLNIKNNKILKILKAQEVNNNINLLNLINNILETRKEKYLTPVVWVLPSEAWYAVPNANRGYRADITDWIHHGWDAYADIWSQIVVITDWVIIRVRDDFKWEDLNLINKKIETDLDWDYNLDIFRWNQVWLKLADWNIVFYSHFSKFEDNIYEWKIVKKWDKLWKVWITWVPEKNYANSHLHFAIMKNNLKNNLELSRYTFNDILKWDWLYKWLKREDLIIKQRELFYKE